MIKQSKIIIKKPTGKYHKYYLDLGYDLKSDKIEIDINHLSLGSKERVLVSCDYCDIEKDISYSDYNKTTKNGELKYACKACGSLKQKELCLEKFGVENYFQIDLIKDKIKKTNLEKWGVDNYTKTDEYKEKSKNTNLEKWGVDNPSKLEEIKDKIKKTNLEKFGVDNYTKTDEYKEKSKKTNLEKFGVDNYTKTDEYKEKSKKTNLEKFGEEHYSKTDEFKKNLKKSSLEKFGVDSYSKTNEFKDKIKKTNLEKWGVDHYSKTEEFKDKIKNTTFDRYGIDNYSKTEESKLKVKKTSLEKWGVDNYTKTDEYKEKSKNTNLEKYEVEHYTKTDEYKKRVKITNLEKFGYNHLLKSPEYRKRFSITNHQNYIKYLDNGNSLFKCDKNNNHDFIIRGDNFYHRLKNNIPLCTICNPIGDQKSIKEKELFEFIQSIYGGEIIQSYRDGIEIDIYLPELKIGFEFNGLYWHSEQFKDKNYHLDKTNYFKERGIRIIHIWEDDWDLKDKIIKSQIENITNNSSKIFARKCTIHQIGNDLTREFINDNHIQGSYKQIKISFGLFYQDELVSIMAFDQFEGRKKMGDGEWNLSRFCNKVGYSVVGGASKLLNFFIKEKNPKRIISYADKDWSLGKVYEFLGFDKIYETKPDYKYIIGEKRTHKSNFKKKTKESKTESQIMNELNILKVWDCGKVKYEKII
jgi:hypothetical protein